MLQIDYSRIMAEITKYEQRLDQMRQFFVERQITLTQAAGDIEALLAKHKCVLPKMDNAFSAGQAETEYTVMVPLRITCRATLTEGIKNTELYAKRLRAAWIAIGNKYDVHISSVYVNSGSVEIHLSVN